MWRFTTLNFLCRGMELLHDITRPVDRTRQDVSRNPGGDRQPPLPQFLQRLPQRHERGGGAFAYFDWDPTRMRVVHTPGHVQPKYQINANDFRYGFVTVDDRWDSAMGAVLEYAARRGQQLMLYVFSDGALDSDGNIDNSVNGRGKGNRKGDSQSTAAVFMPVYDPAGRPQLASPARQQLGYYRRSGDVETASSPIANNVTLLADAVVLNYMALHDDVGRFATALPTQGLGSNLDSLIAFAPIRPTPT